MISDEGSKMLSLKKRIVMIIALVMLLIATALPAAAADTTVSSTPSGDSNTLTIQLGSISVSLSLPIRCGNNC